MKNNEIKRKSRISSVFSYPPLSVVLAVLVVIAMNITLKNIYFLRRF